MSWKVVNLVADKRVGSPARKLVLIAMADHANPDGAGVFASFATLAEMAEVSRPTVKRIVKEFLDEGLIEHVGERECRYGKTNIYDLKISAIEALPATAADRASKGEEIAKTNPVQIDPGKPETGVNLELTRFKLTPKPHPEPLSLFETNVSHRPTGEIPKKPKSKDYHPAFMAIWKSWPKWKRERSDKPTAYKRWLAGVELFGIEAIDLAAKHYLASPATTKDGFQYCCAVEVFMNGKLEAAVEAATNALDEPKRKVWSADLNAFVEEGQAH